MTESIDYKLRETLLRVMSLPTRLSSAGYPYLERPAWEIFRDTVPYLLGTAPAVLEAAEEIAKSADGAAGENMRRAWQVIRQVVLTATITAPPDLWLMRHVLGAFAENGLLERLVRGEAIYPEHCSVEGGVLEPRELEIDLHFLLARGIVEQYENSFRIAGHPTVQRIAREMTPVPRDVPAAVSRLWRAHFNGELDVESRSPLLALGGNLPRRVTMAQTHWVPSLEEIELGYRLVPLVLGLRASGADGRMPDVLESTDEVDQGACEILRAVGWLDDDGLTLTGLRGLERGPGPFGIIEAYNPYVAHACDLLRGRQTHVWVQRSENVGASQDANRKTFEQANDAVDRFCSETGFSFQVFVEHAIGRGEATRQRFERSGDAQIRYFGADLEDAAIDAALAEQRAGELPAAMVFVRGADIGEPDVLVHSMRAAGADPAGAVMLVGNGFHEVRDQTDERMIEVFRGYHDAGIILVFTEENALSVDDMRATAFNTYHAGFKYVHEKSGQGLRPAHPSPIPRLGQPLRAPWSECASRAGYVRAERFCSRSRTVYPYTPLSGHNPRISESHFVVPRPIAASLGLAAGRGSELSG